MTKQLTALIFFLFISCYVQSQAINQSPITINGIVCQLHYNGDASVKHPLIMFFQGAGQFGSDPNSALVHGTGWAIQNGKWNPDSTFNFNTNQYESYIVLSTLNIAKNQTPSDAQIEGLYTYMRNNYPVDSNCMVITGLSAGGAPATDFGAHVSGSNCCPPIYTFTTRKNILAAEIPMSAEILDSSQGVTQPVQFQIADSIPMWGWADSNDCQGHGLPLKHWVAHVNRIAPSLGSLFTHFHSNVQCHGGWDSIYTATTRQTIDGHSMNIYEWALYKRRGAAPTPPTQTITIGSIAQSSFCVTPTATASFSVTYTTTGTFNAGNTFNVQMSDATGSFSSFINVGSGTISPISCIIPANTTTGANYRFRIQSSNPIVSSSPSPIKAINLAANKIVPTGNQTVNINVAGTTLTVRDSSTATSHQWYNNSVAIAGQTGTTYIPLFASVSVDTITCKSVFSCATRTSNKVIINVVSPSSSLVIPTKNTACGIHNFSSANPGDTILLDSSLLDTLCELTFIHLNGTAAKPITIINKGLILSTAALTFVDDCHYVNANFGTNVNAPHATGSVSLGQFGSKAYDIPYGLKVFGAVVPGGAVEIHGKDSNITVSNVYEPNRGAIGGAAGYGIVMKNDPAAFGCDLSYDYPNTFANITFHDMVFQNINKDVIYLGYSGGYNTNGQSVTCNGVVIYPRPAIIAGLTMYNIYCNTAQRTFIQGGGLSGGNNVFHDMYADNLGGDSLNGVIDGSQGAFAAFGIPDSSVTLYNCGGNKTWLHNIYSYHYGTANFFNNTFDSAGYLTVHGVVQINPSQSSIAFFPKANIYNTATQLILQNNRLGKNSANFNVRLDFGNNPYATTGNIICNSGNVYNPPNVQYSTCAPLNTITAKNISPITFCITPTVGANITITFTTTGTFNANNVFTAYLSDANGSFASQTAIGSSATKSISAIIPANIPYGSGYKIVVQSSNPVVIGTASLNTATINLVSSSIAPTATQNIFTDSLGNTLTVTDASPNGTHKWFKNGSVITGETNSTYTPKLRPANTYTITEKTTYPCGVATSNAVTIVVTDLPPPPPDTVFTSAISGSPFCIAPDLTTTVSVSYTSNRTSFNAGNVFNVQLSNANGSFASPVIIGTSTSTLAAGTIICTIPSNTPTGTRYRIRVRPSKPTATLIKNNANLTINLASVNVTPSATQNILINTNGIPLTANEGSAPISRVWLYGNVSGTYPTNTGNTTNTYTPNFAAAGSYYVVDVSTFACETDTSNAVLINATIPNPPPPDTTCTTYQIQHDTVKIDTFRRITLRDSIITVSEPFYFYILRIKIRIPGIVVISSDTLHLKDTTYYDSAVHHITPLHDTTICVPSYRMGVYYFNIGTPINLQIDTVKNYIGVRYIRFNITRGGGGSWHTQQANDSGMHVLYTINNSTAGAAGFAAYVTSNYNQGKPEISTSNNEPTINVGSMANELIDQQTLIDVSHPLGIKVTNGGITADVAYYIVNYWNTHGKSDSATWLRTTLGLNMSSPAALKAIGQYDTLLTAYASMNLDYVNIHFAEPIRGDTTAIYPSGLLPIFVNFIRVQTGKPVMSNEYHTSNTSCNLLSQTTLQALNAGLQYLIYFDGDGSGGAVKNQDCFKQIIQNLQ